MINDGGYKSRKMIMAYVVMLLGTIGYIATGKWSALSMMYPQYCMFLLGSASIYISGNTIVKWLANRKNLQ